MVSAQVFVAPADSYCIIGNDRESIEAVCRADSNKTDASPQAIKILNIALGDHEVS
jgi:hypothetical protein